MLSRRVQFLFSGVKKEHHLKTNATFKHGRRGRRYALGEVIISMSAILLMPIIEVIPIISGIHKTRVLKDWLRTAPFRRKPKRRRVPQQKERKKQTDRAFSYQCGRN